MKHSETNNSTDSAHGRFGYLLLSWILVGAVCAAAVAGVYHLLRFDVDMEFAQRVPGTDGREDLESAAAIDPRDDLQLETFDVAAADLSGSWPQFRGPDRNGISPDDVPLASQWPQEGPPVLWEIEVGEGYAGAAVLNGRVYIVDYDREGQRDVIRCLSLLDGQDIWRFSYPIKIKRNHGMSRTVPAVTDEYLVAIGPKCHVTCLDTNTGDFRWMIDLAAEYGTVVPPWYAGQCPLIEDGRVILAPAGTSLMIAVDCASGEVLWETPNTNSREMTHSSIMPVDFADQHMYVYCASAGVAGVSTDGRLLWDTPEWKIRIANIASPTILDEGRLFFSGGYNSGSAMMFLSAENSQISTEIAYRLDPEIFGSPQHTPIYYQGYIYGVRPDGQLVCLHPGGDIVWTSSPVHKFGLGPYTIADGLIYVMNDMGLLSMVQARPDSFVLLGQAKVLEGPDSWGPMAIAGGRLIARDLNRMVCLDVGAR